MSKHTALSHHANRLNGSTIEALFHQNPSRKTDFTIESEHLKLDFSRQRIDSALLLDLIDFSREQKLKDSTHALFNAHKINKTESRAALHTAFRTDPNQPELTLQIKSMQEQMTGMVNKLHAHQWLGATGQPITDVVHLGIGGSYWGPQCLLDAFADYPELMAVHCVAELDHHALSDVLKKLNPASTLFVIASKSFTTYETMDNAKRAIKWLKETLGTDLSAHLIAITEKVTLAKDLGIAPANILPMWDWVGGRYSIWSAIALPVCVRYGMQLYWDLLAGAAAMDKHFLESDDAQNIPLIMALLSYWNTQYCHMPAEVILPYPYRLRSIIPHLQQLCMESLGKACTLEGDTLDQLTGPMVWGCLGSQAQHTFNQWLHQSPYITPVEFILPLYDKPLLAQGLAQSQALAFGDHHPNVHARLTGNRPHSILSIKRLDPQTMGALLALYEHKVFCFAMLLNINPFDQFGVEYSKKIAGDILKDISTAV